MATRYRVYFTPLTATNVYGDEVEVTDYITIDGLPSIKRAIDSQDYDIGVFTYDDLQLKAINRNGYFNDELDIRSLFTFSRDLCKVRVVFENDTTGESIVFRGLINEEATRVNATGEEVQFRVLSRDSVIRTTKVSAGAVSNGTSCKTAMLQILADAKISSVLNTDALDVNPDYDFEIDLGNKFDNKSARDVLNLLLIASNSVMLIDDSDNVIIGNRDEDLVTDILNLYGPYDIRARQNVISMQDYNSGRQRTFTSFKVNNTEVSSDALASTYGYRQKKLTLDFITDTETETEIATRLLGEFAAPKIELTIDVSTYVARNAGLLSRIAIDWPYRVKPIEQKFLPVIGGAVIGDALTPLPYTFGSVKIPPEMGFKVLEIAENPRDFTTKLKLRQVGKTLSDGWYTTPANSVIGYAVIGVAPVASPAGALEDTWNPSVVGAALIGSTEIA
jgi:hypothetical protein